MNTPTLRDPAIDIARGIAIIAIALGHVLRGLIAGGIIDGDLAAVGWLDRWLYAWHLPVFALLSGLFLPRTRDRTTYIRFLCTRAGEWVYLYVLWTVLQTMVRIGVGGAANEPAKLSDLVQLWHPQGQLWFLPWLILAAVIGGALRPWKRVRTAAIVLLASTLLAFMTWGYDGGVIGAQGLSLFVWYFTGSVIGAARFTDWLGARSNLILFATASVAVGLSGTLAGIAAPGPTSGGVTTSAPLLGLGVLTSLSGVTAVVALAAAIARLPGNQWLASIGRQSMPIFLAHVIAAAGTRVLLLRFGIDDISAQVTLGLTVGVIAPILLARTLQTLRLPWLFSMPRRAQRALSR